MDQSMKPIRVREVWADNLEYEFFLIKMAISGFPIVSLDTEFPGALVQLNPHMGKGLLANPSIHYRLMKRNVDLLKLIQLGMTLSDSHGNLPSFGTDYNYVWQFNFRDFDIHRDPCNLDSVRLLAKQGMDFMKNKEKGIDSSSFARLLLSSGLVFNRSITWITFHGAYDFGLLIKIMTGRQLPWVMESFLGLVGFFFGARVYDTKVVMGSVGGLHGGLERVAQILNVDRKTGRRHQAGSDSLLTLQTFMRFKDIVHVNFDFRKINGYEGMMYGFCQRLGVLELKSDQSASLMDKVIKIINPPFPFSTLSCMY